MFAGSNFFQLSRAAFQGMELKYEVDIQSTFSNFVIAIVVRAGLEPATP